jgi:hypothetical protein
MLIQTITRYGLSTRTGWKVLMTMVTEQWPLVPIATLIRIHLKMTNRMRGMNLAFLMTLILQVDGRQQKFW